MTFNHAFRKIFRMRVVRFPLYFLLGAIFLIALLNVLVFLYLGVMEVVDAHGYCPKKQTYITSDGRIGAAINAINGKRSVYIYAENKDYPRIPYKSIADFKERNPNCCAIYPADKWEEFFNRMGKSASSAVRIKYTAYYQINTDQVGSKTFDVVVPVNSCGDVINTFD